MSDHAKTWKIRFIFVCLLVILAFIGLVVTDVKEDGGWWYWRLIIPVFAISSIWLSWYMRKKSLPQKGRLIWQELVHWLGLVFAVLLVSKIVNIGIMGRFEASIMILILLALTTFTAGVYTEFTFIFVGLLLGFVAYGVAFLDQYLYAIMIPLTLMAIGSVFYFIYHKKHIHQDKPLD